MMTGNLTAEGRALLAKGVTLNFTKMQIGDKNSNMSFDIPIRIEKIENGKVYITGVLDLSSVKQGFFWRECGLYAMDPDVGEILYNYAYSTKPDYIAASNSGMMEEILVNMIATVGSNTNVDVTIDDSMVFATKRIVDDIINNHLTVSIKDFGAKGDGITDDTNSFKAAIGKCIEKGLSLFIPYSESGYLVTDTVYCGEFSLSVCGSDGKKTPILFKPNNTSVPFLEYTSNPSEILIKNINFLGNENAPGGVFISTKGDIRYSKFENISISYIDTCFYFNGNVYANTFKNVRSIAVKYNQYMPNETGDKSLNNVSYSDCNFRSTVYGCYIKNYCNDVTFYNCVFDIKDTTNTDGKGGIYFSNPRVLNFIGGYVEARDCSVFEFDLADTSYDYRIKISNMYIRNNYKVSRNSVAVKVTGRIGLVIDSCYFNGWDKCIDYTLGTGSLTDENNAYVNSNKSIDMLPSTNYYNEMRGVVDSGYNENGRYIKFYDGTMICQQNITSSTSEDTVWTFPKDFLSTSSMSVNATLSFSGLEMASITLTSRTSKSAVFKAIRINNSTKEVERVSSTCHLTAVGRWR